MTLWQAGVVTTTRRATNGAGLATHLHNGTTASPRVVVTAAASRTRNARPVMGTSMVINATSTTQVTAGAGLMRPIVDACRA